MTRSTRKQEIVKAAEESIAYQIADVLQTMQSDSGIKVSELRVDGGPTHNQYLMQFQSDILGCDVLVPKADELSGLGAAYLSGISIGILDEKTVFTKREKNIYSPKMTAVVREEKYNGWKKALNTVLESSEN